MLVDLCASLYLHFVEHSNVTVINTVYNPWNNEHLKNVNCKSIRNRLTLIHVHLLREFIKFFCFFIKLILSHFLYWYNIFIPIVNFDSFDLKKSVYFLKIKFYIECVIRTANLCSVLLTQASKFFFSTNQKYLFKRILVKQLYVHVSMDFEKCF